MSEPRHIVDARAIVVDLLGFDPANVGQMIREAAEQTRDEWRRLAQAKLKSTASMYIEGVQIVEVNEHSVTIALLPKLSNLQEQGAPGWDLRDTLLGPGAKTSQDGYRYRTIFFRHMTPGSSGKFGKVMPRKIHNRAKRLRGTVSGPDAAARIAMLDDPDVRERHAERLMSNARGTLWGGIPELDPPGGELEGRLPSGLASKAKLYHATDLYDGMIRHQKTYGKRTQSTYGTFRVISNNPNTLRDPFGRSVKNPKKVPVANWKHPGFVALNLADEATEYAQNVAIPAVFGESNAVTG